MKTDREICRPGGLQMTELLFRQAGLWDLKKLQTADVGCGRGASVVWLRQTHPDWSVTGIDPNSCPEEGICMKGEAEHLPFSDGSLDAVLMECSFSKTRDPETALREVIRVLKPGGKLLMSDMYAKKEELSGVSGILGRLEKSSTIYERLRSAGFAVLEMDDRSDELAEWIGQKILDGEIDAFYENLGRSREELKRAGCGYFTCTAEVSPLWEMLCYTREKSAFYREKWKDLPDGDFLPGDWERFRSLPFTAPEEIREKPEALLCVNPKEIARVITLKTSGSQGKPKRLFFTEQDLMLTADFFEKGIQYLVKPGDRVTVYMEGPSLYSIGGLLKEGLGRIHVEVKVHGLIRDLKAAARDGEGRNCFIGVPSQMYGLAVEAPQLRPDTVLLSADYVPKSVKEFLEQTWGCRVFSHWGMTETGYGGGVQCGAREGYHLRDGDLLLEMIDPETGEPVPDGEYGEIVLTTLTRRGMPLVRYRTGDLCRFCTGTCGCGSLKPRLDLVEGRLDDVIRIGGGRVLSMHILDELLLSSGSVQDFEAFYDPETHLLALDLMLKEEKRSAEKEEKNKILNDIICYFDNMIKVELRFREVSPYIGSGKRKIKKMAERTH